MIYADRKINTRECFLMVFSFFFFLIVIQFVEQRLHLWKGNVVLQIVAKKR